MAMYLVAGAFALVAVALCVAALVGAHRALRLRRDGLRSRATVVELLTRHLQMQSSDERRPDDPLYAPVFEFVTPEGKVHRVEGDASSPPSYKVGDEVSVLFDPADPGGARVETFAGQWLGVLLAGLGGAITLAVAGLIFWLAANER